MASTLKIQNGDILMDQATGRPLYVSGATKTRQDFGELLSIATQSNGFGAGLVDLVGSVPENPMAVSFKVTQLISEAVDRWMGLQRKVRAILTDEEVVKSLDFNQAITDPVTFTTVSFRATILTRAGEITRGGSINAVGGA